MALDDYKVTASDYANRDIAGLPDDPSDQGMSAATLKARFDTLTKEVLVPKHNGLIEALDDESATTARYNRGTISGEAIAYSNTIGATTGSITKLTGASAQTVSEQGKNLFNLEADDYVTGRSNATIISRTDSEIVCEQTVIGYTATGYYGNDITLAAGTYTISLQREIISGTATSADSGLLRIIAAEDSRTVASLSRSVSSRDFTLSDTTTVRLLFTFVRPDETETIRIRYSNIQLEAGSAATAYEPFVPDSPSPDYPSEITSAGECDITVTDAENTVLSTISVAETLRGLPSGAADTIEPDGDGWKYVQRVGVYEFDDTTLNGWDYSPNYSGEGYSCFWFNGVYMPAMARSEGDILSTHLLKARRVWAYAREGISIDYSTNAHVWVKASDTIAADLLTWRAWITAQHTAGTPLTVQYELATPIETPITGTEAEALSAALTIGGGTTNITDDGAVHITKEVIIREARAVPDSDRLGGVAADQYVSVNEQSFIAAEQTQARDNIDAAATAHTHDYLPLTGGSVAGNIQPGITASADDTQGYNLGGSAYIWKYLFAKYVGSGTVPVEKVTTGQLVVSDGATFAATISAAGNIISGSEIVAGGTNGARLVADDSRLTLYPKGVTDPRVVLGILSGAWAFSPAGANRPTLGDSSHKWGQIYSTQGTISTSDKTEKNTIAPLDDEKTEAFILAMKPVSYKYNDGASGRTHYGMISQDVETALDKLGLSSLDFAGFIKSPKYIDVEEIDEETGEPRFKQELVSGEYTYGLRYEEFIAPMLKEEQRLIKKVGALTELLVSKGVLTQAEADAL